MSDQYDNRSYRQAVSLIADYGQEGILSDQSKNGLNYRGDKLFDMIESVGVNFNGIAVQYEITDTSAPMRNTIQYIDSLSDAELRTISHYSNKGDVVRFNDSLSDAELKMIPRFSDIKPSSAISKGSERQSEEIQDEIMSYESKGTQHAKNLGATALIFSSSYIGVTYGAIEVMGSSPLDQCLAALSASAVSLLALKGSRRYRFARATKKYRELGDDIRDDDSLAIPKYPDTAIFDVSDTQDKLDSAISLTDYDRYSDSKRKLSFIHTSTFNNGKTITLDVDIASLYQYVLKHATDPKSAWHLHLKPKGLAYVEAKAIVDEYNTQVERQQQVVNVSGYGIQELEALRKLRSDATRNLANATLSIAQTGVYYANEANRRNTIKQIEYGIQSFADNEDDSHHPLVIELQYFRSVIVEALSYLDHSSPTTVKVIQSANNYLTQVREHATNISHLEAFYIGFYNKFSGSMTLPKWEDVSERL